MEIKIESKNNYKMNNDNKKDNKSMKNVKKGQGSLDATLQVANIDDVSDNYEQSSPEYTQSFITKVSSSSKSVELCSQEGMKLKKPKKRIHILTDNDDNNSNGNSLKPTKSSPSIKKKKTKLEDIEKIPQQECDQKQITHPTTATKKCKNKKEQLKTEPISIKREDSDDFVAEKNKKKSKKTIESDDEDFKKVKKLKKISKTSIKKESEQKKEPKVKKETKKVKKEIEEKEEIWKWWEDDPLPEGVKWLKLEHNGPLFPPEYEPLPLNIKFYYDGKPIKLSKDAEEVASFYAKMLDHDYTKKDIFNKNFFNDWREVMTPEERKIIVHLKNCNFNEMAEYYKNLQEQKKSMSKEEKDVIKQQNLAITERYGYCMMDGHKQKVGNFRIEPPGLFRGRGDHPKQGKLKKRVKPSDVIINIGKDAKVPDPPYGKWKAVYHDNSVSWLACWVENILGSYKYVMLNPTAKLKGQKDMEKFNTARTLRQYIDKIRKNYKEDWKAKDMKTRQRSVALYFIDKLALRAGHEKDEGESADTVGCCSLRVEHIKLHPKYEGDDFVVEFDFLGKDSIRYRNHVPIEKQVYKNLKLFMKNKEPSDDLFDRLNTASLNKYLNELMENLTAKVFRTYNASNTLQEQLELLTQPDASINEKVLAYNRANRAVAILCNHQRAVPKTFEKTMENLNNKLLEKKKEISALKEEIRNLKKNNNQKELEKKKKKLKSAKEQRLKMELNITDRDENKEIALGTSKLNYLDPRITVSWCKKHDVPIEKVYNKTHREKFQWAIDMTDKDYIF